MNTFPLIHTKRSNEHRMADVFKVLLLYHLPLWIGEPTGILRFFVLVAAGVLIDAVFSLLRYKKMWCCVSGAITAAIISLLAVGVPLWGQLLGIVIGLIVGKQVWGGTGKNFLNPAMVGMFAVMLMFDVEYPFFTPSLWLLPAVITGLFFLKVRPFTGVGFLLGMIISMYLYKDLTFLNLMTYGVFFWSCLVMTDPVTVTRNKPAGIAAGFLAGFGTLLFSMMPIAVILCILLVNLFSAVVDDITVTSHERSRTSFKLPKAVAKGSYQKKFIDLSGEKDQAEEQDITEMTMAQLLDRISKNHVFGMGGAAFDTHRKLMAVLNSKEKEKQFIINAVECDPGLLHDAWLLRNYPMEIRKGIEVLCRCIEFKKVYLAVKDNNEIPELGEVQVVKISDRYPMGAERILIKEVLKKSLSKEQLPSQEGILVLNVQTVYSIYRAVYLNQPINTRFLTVADLKLKNAKIVKVKLGSKVQEILEVVYPGNVSVFAGGGLMQAYVADEDAVTDETVNFIAAANHPKYKESPQCSHCGECSDHCPGGLKVYRVAELIDQGATAALEKYHVQDCIQCGSCSYLCPAGRNLAAKVKKARDFV